MLQKFHTTTLQSNYIKYILNNFYIPTVPFTSNILHITQGNTYIHDGYFVIAKVSSALPPIREAIQKNSLDYAKYFIKQEPYVFGKQYPGLTTNYKSNTIDYDSTTHYYLGEYLRAYKAYYNIDLMPYYNCFSNEYLNYIKLEKSNHGKIIYNDTTTNTNFTIISVPIKFCQKYTIAISCPSEVLMLPVFVDKKGILKTKTNELNSLDYWGKSYPDLRFDSPIVFESPHINSVSDTTQAALQTYDRYLKLLIQVPSNLKSSIVVLEGEFHNTKTNSKRIINTSEEDIKKLYGENYSIEFSKDYIAANVPIKDTITTTLTANYYNVLYNHDYYIDYNNKIIDIKNSNNEEFLGSIQFNIDEEDKSQQNYIENILNLSNIKDNLYSSNEKIKFEIIKDNYNIEYKQLYLDDLRLNSESFGSNYTGNNNENNEINGKYKIKLFNNIKNNLYHLTEGTYLVNGANYYITNDTYLNFKDSIMWGSFIASDIANGRGIRKHKVIATTLDSQNKSIKALVANKGEFLYPKLYKDYTNNIKTITIWANSFTSLTDSKYYGNYNDSTKTCSFIGVCINDNVLINGEHIEIPETIYNNGKAYKVISIENRAFENCGSIKSIKIPTSITKMVGQAFYTCNNLTKVLYDGTIDQWVNIDFTSYYGANPLYQAGKSTDTDSGLYVLLSSTETEEGKEYIYKLIQHVELSENTNEIKRNSFANYEKLKSIGISKNIIRVGQYAFRGCKSNSEEFQIYCEIDKRPSLEEWHANWNYSYCSVAWSYADIDFYIYDLKFKLDPTSNIQQEEPILKIYPMLQIAENDDFIPINLEDQGRINIELSQYFKNIETCNIKYIVDNASNKILLQDIWSININKISKTTLFATYLNSYLYSNLSLLKFNNQISYAFSGRLIEYLLNNVIASNEVISKNIKRVQSKLDPNNSNGIWDDNLRIKSFEKIVKRSQELVRQIPLDVNGFIDKDSEALIVIDNIINQGVFWS